MDKYIVIELQTAADGAVATLVTVCDDYRTAQQTYHTILAAAAVSALPVHSAAIMLPNGVQIEHQAFDRTGEE